MKVGLRGQQGPVSIQQADANLYKRKGTLSVPPFDPYARRLSMYPNPPVGEVGTDEFETLALERLKSTLNCRRRAAHSNPPFSTRTFPIFLPFPEDKH